MVPHAILLAAAMSVESPFLHDAGRGGGGGDGKDSAGGGGGSGGGGGGGESPGTVPRAGGGDQKGGKKGRKGGGDGKRAREAHARLRHAAGDALSALNALCAYLAVSPGAEDAFCRCAFS